MSNLKVEIGDTIDSCIICRNDTMCKYGSIIICDDCVTKMEDRQELYDIVNANAKLKERLQLTRLLWRKASKSWMSFTHHMIFMIFDHKLRIYEQKVLIQL